MKTPAGVFWLVFVLMTLMEGYVTGHFKINVQRRSVFPPFKKFGVEAMFVTAVSFDNITTK